MCRCSETRPPQEACARHSIFNLAVGRFEGQSSYGAFSERDSKTK
jgi:hypothetical protein